MPAGRPSFLTPQQKKEKKDALMRKWQKENKDIYHNYQKEYRLNSVKKRAKDCLVKTNKSDKIIIKKIDSCTNTKDVRKTIKTVLTHDEYRKF